MATMTVDVALEAGDLLGEGPVWCAEEQSLYWVDIKKPSVRSWKPGTGEQRVWPVQAEIGSMALRSRGGMVLALRDGFAFLDLESGEVTPLHDPEPDLPGTRFNDGKCDPQGRFWAGTMDCEEVEGLGSLYRLDHDHSCHRMVDGVICSNGLGWSPDGRTMYYTDTWTRRIDAFDFDPATGEVGNRRIFAEVPDGDGAPDGLAVDAEGGVWSARWDGWKVVRHAPDGSVDAVVETPVPRPTSCAFGGSDLRDLYVTSASVGLDHAARAAAPLSGSLFRVRTAVCGQRGPEFGG